MLYHPGEANVRMADVVIINKVQTADRKDILTVRENVMKLNPKAIILEAASPIHADSCHLIRGQRTLVVEDGPTVTHGGMKYGAGTIAAQDHCSGIIVDPRPYAVRSIAATYQKYPDLGPILPAMGYGEEQVRDLEETINNADVEVVVSGTPVDLNRVLKSNKPIVRVRYELAEIGTPKLAEIIQEKIGPLLDKCHGGNCSIL
jgi:predicted GTPase